MSTPDGREPNATIKDDFLNEGKEDVLKLVKAEENATSKRKPEHEDDFFEHDAKKHKINPKEDRIKKLKDQLRKQEEELEKIKRDREATKTLLSLYESDT